MVLSKKRARHVIEEIIALFPDAKPSLDFRNHFELLVAVMLSAQTQFSFYKAHNNSTFI